MGGECQRCHWTGHQAALVPHHVVPESKDKTFKIYNTNSWVRTKIEMDKCVLLCSNCHFIVHSTSDPKWMGDASIIPSRDDSKLSRSYSNCGRCKDRIRLGSRWCKSCAGVLSHLNRCKDCGARIYIKSKRCNDCNGKINQKIAWPCSCELIEMVKIKNYSVAGRDLGVSDNAIRKRIKTHPCECGQQ